jgi:hypothetical protein
MEDLPEPPKVSLRLAALIGPGLMMVGANIGGGEWLLGPLVTARYGGRVMWVANLAILMQVFYNLAVMRYTLYCGETILTGFLRTRPGPRFWVAFYMLGDLGALWPYLASNAAVPLAAAFLGRLPGPADDGLVRWLGYLIFIAAFVPLIFGGKVYNMLERIMVVKLFLVLSYLAVIVLVFVSWRTWWEIGSGLFRFGSFPEGDFRWATLAAFAAIAGAGGMSNATFSNYARDEGWGMGARVGALPSAIGGRSVQLSHSGAAFPVTSSSLARWRGWLRHMYRDQLLLWAPGCVLGAALPAMFSYEFVRGTTVEGHALTGLTAQAMAARHGQVFWFLTLLCGFLVLAPTQVGQLDGICRRWTDVIWTASSRLRGVDGHKVKYVYYAIMVAYGLWGLLALRLTPNPTVLALGSGVMMNFALGFSALHVLFVDIRLLPEALRPGWVMRIGLVLCAVFYTAISVIAFLQEWPALAQWAGR